MSTAMSARWACTIWSCGQRSPEALAIAAHRHGLVERPPREAERGRTDRGAEHVEGRHGNPEAVAGGANQGRGRQATLLEADPRKRVRRHRVQPLGHGESWRRRGHDERAQALRAGSLAGPGEDHVDIGDAPVRDPGLLAIQYPAVAVAPGPGSKRRDIRSRAGSRSAQTRRWRCPRACARPTPAAGPSNRTAKSAPRRGPAWRRRNPPARRGGRASRATARGCARRDAHRAAPAAAPSARANPLGRARPPASGTPRRGRDGRRRRARRRPTDRAAGRARDDAARRTAR